MVVTASYLQEHPLNFVLYYENYVNLNTIYLDDGYPALPLYLEIFNLSDQDIKLSTPAANNARNTKEQCHFYLRVPQGVLKIADPESIISDDNWKVVYVPASSSFSGGTTPPPGGTTSPGAVPGYDTLYFSCNTEKTIQAKNPDNRDDPRNKIILTLDQIHAAPGVQSRSSSIRLSIGGLTAYNNPTDPVINLADKGYDYGLFVINHLGKKTIPLHAGFAGSNTILNDGGTANQLQLQITNIQKADNDRRHLAIGKDSRFIISFEEGTLDKEWALAESDQIKAIQIDAPDQDVITDPNTNPPLTETIKWDVQSETNPNRWILKLPEGRGPVFLGEGKAIILNIANIKSNHPSGQTKLTIRYEEIPNYWDGDLVCLIEKTPLMYRSPLKATANDQTLTAVRIKTNFDDNSKTGVKHIGLAVETGDVKFKDNLYIESGNVGIGTTSPTEKLEVTGSIKVKDNLYIETGNVGIGINNPTEKLEVTGSVKVTENLYIETGKLGIDVENPTEKLEVNGNVKVKDNLYIENGKVGIGTTDPSEKLDVAGNIQTNKALIGCQWPAEAGFCHKDVSDTKKDYALIQNSSGRTSLNSASGQPIWFRINNEDKMHLDKDGKLGIGTTSPTEKLEVTGNITTNKAYIGSKWDKWAGFSHKDQKNTTGFALAQHSNGTTVLNAASGQNIRFSTDDIQRAKVDSLGLHSGGGLWVDSVPVWDGAGAYDVTWNNGSGRISREGSSLRYKKNVTALEDDFSKILQLQPKQYQIKEEFEGQGNLNFGYIAEELDELGLTNLVTYDESRQPDGIKYKKMCIYLLEVVKDLNKKVDSLYHTSPSES